MDVFRYRCADIMDENLFKNIKKLNQINNLYHPVDFLIVPSFTEKPWILSGTVEYISRQCNTTVVYVNNYSELSRPEIFISGVKQKIIGPKKNPIGENAPDIYLFDLNLAEIRKARLSSETVSLYHYGELGS